MLYREPLSYTRLRASELRERERREQPLRALAARISEREIGRAAAGAVGIGGAAVVTLNLWSEAADARTTALLGTWVAAAAAWLLARAVARAALHRSVRGVEDDRDPDVECARLERRPRSVARGFDMAGAVLPMVAVALLAPLTIHAGVAVWWGLRGFDEWIVWSLKLVGAAHVALAVYAGLYARHLVLRPGAGWESALGHGFSAVAVAALAGCVPGIVAILPPLLVGLTGVLFVPLSFCAMRAVIARDRALRARADAVLAA